MDTAIVPRESGASDLSVDQSAVSRLVVTWQHPVDRDISPIGLLTYDGREYSFSYLKNASKVEGFRPLIGFPVLEQRYASDELFPIFAQRAMDPRRPDFQRYVSDLGLENDASPWEQIARSGGARGSDTLQLFPVPRYSGDGWTCSFLVHGMRHLLTKSVMVGQNAHPQYEVSGFERVLSGLTRGDVLRVEHETSNKHSAHSLLATTVDDDPVGWVPNWLALEVLQLQSEGCLAFRVDKVNPALAGWHMRMVVNMRADCPADFEFFTGPDWETFV